MNPITFAINLGRIVSVRHANGTYTHWSVRDGQLSLDSVQNDPAQEPPKMPNPADLQTAAQTAFTYFRGKGLI